MIIADKNNIDIHKVPVIEISGGLRVLSGSIPYDIPSIKLTLGKWIVFVPVDADPATDPAGVLSRCLASLSAPARGSVLIKGKDVYNINYRDMQRLRARIGFVQGFGGLLSNRTIRENLNLPVSIHAKLQQEDEYKKVTDQLNTFGLLSVANERPHLLDGFTKWRSCLARGLILNPELIILEGIGDWAIDSGKGIAWSRLVEYNNKKENVICICAARRNKGFETWFKEHGGIVLGYADTKTTREYLQ